MKAQCRSLILGFLMILASCGLEENKGGISILSSNFDFSQDSYGWQAGFSDYPAGPDDSLFFELKHSYTQQPNGVNAIMISGNNHSDDLFMFIKKKLTGLQPNTNYTLTFDVEFGSDAVTAGNTGVVGAPGESVFLKAGASGVEPKSVIDRGFFIMNIDKGNQREGGADMVTIGNVAAPSSSSSYVTANRTNSSSTESPLEVRSNNNGDLWLIVGTDSGFQGVTTLYYSRIKVALSTPE